MVFVATLHFPEARQTVLDRMSAADPVAGIEELAIEEAAGRVLAEDVTADRDYPPVSRSLRDGYALRAAEAPGGLRVKGEVRAGEIFRGTLGAGEAMEIMTGAPLPFGADAVLMVEHARREGARVHAGQPVEPGAHVLARGAEARQGDVLIPRGARIGYPQIAMLATVGHNPVRVYRQPRVAILATGDEIVETSELPADYQIRNSNAYSLAAQVRSAGGAPEILPVARDTRESITEGLERGLTANLLLVSGGVSAGKYDLVEPVLQEFGAEFYFDRVLIQPGQPLVFGWARGTYFFGLPGNPVSSMVTFEVFARAALEFLGGQRDPLLPIAYARLTASFRHKPGLTRFLPARFDGRGNVTPVRWQGSSDVPAVARSNVFLIAEEDREAWSAGEWIRVLLRR